MHKIVICEKCLKIIEQCRCMDCAKAIIYSICDECKLTDEDIKNANAHQILKTLGIVDAEN